MSYAQVDAAFLDVLDLPTPQLGASASPLARVPVEEFWESSGAQAPQLACDAVQGRGKPCTVRGRHNGKQRQDCFAASNIAAPLLHLGHPSGACADADKRRAYLNSVDSAMSTAEIPENSSKLFSEPARAVDDPCPFNVQTLDFLADEATGVPETMRSVRLKISTAPPDFNVDACRPSPFSPCHPRLLSQQQPFSLPKSRPAGDRDRQSSSSGSAGGGASQHPAAFYGDAQRCDGGEAAISLSEVRGGSLHSVGTSPGPEDWANPELKRAFEKTNINPRKTEQNRRAQARFRQRKKDLFVEQQRQIQELTTRLEQAMREKKSYQEKTSLLQKMVEAKEKRIEALKGQSKEHAWLDELVDSCWEFVLELKKGRQGLNCTREALSDMVSAMLHWGAPALAFIRREVVEQLAVCLKQNGELPDTPANLWLNDIVAAYEKMVNRWGECRPQAFRSFLGLQLPEQSGRTADAEFWKKVLVAGSIRLDQRRQLATARNSLISKMQQLVGRRRDIARLVQSGGPENTLNQQPLLGNMAQAQHVLDLHGQILREEQSAVFSFLTIIRLVLDSVQQAKLMVASFPFALDTLAVCSLIADEEDSLSTLSGNLALIAQLPSDSPFRTLTPNPTRPPTQLLQARLTV